MTDSKRVNVRDGAEVSPGDFPLHSPESRAAARAKVEKGKNKKPDLRITLITYAPPDEDEGLPAPSRWVNEKGQLCEMVFQYHQSEKS